MAGQKTTAHGPSKLPKRTETQLLSLLPDEDETTTKTRRSARLPDGREAERAAGRAAADDRMALQRFLKRMGYTADEWERRRRHYLEAPQSDEELNSNTWKAAKLRHSGAAVEVALKRQKTLNPDLWMIAFLMAQGNERDDMPFLIGFKRRRVYQLIDELRRIVRHEIHADTDSAVTRWFLGL